MEIDKVFLHKGEETLEIELCDYLDAVSRDFGFDEEGEKHYSRFESDFFYTPGAVRCGYGAVLAAKELGNFMHGKDEAEEELKKKLEAGRIARNLHLRNDSGLTAYAEDVDKETGEVYSWSFDFRQFDYIHGPHIYDPKNESMYKVN